MKIKEYIEQLESNFKTIEEILEKQVINDKKTEKILLDLVKDVNELFLYIDAIDRSLSQDKKSKVYKHFEFRKAIIGMAKLANFEDK